MEGRSDNSALDLLDCKSDTNFSFAAETPIPLKDGDMKCLSAD